ncbi:MAG: fused response regulator/phosphatase [Verrucomicrobiota bacterium]|nr:fused response regulator/phosphatase [Verrucomicrobiota bacterium]
MERIQQVILVIDDDRASRRMLTRALGEAGCTCRESSSGVEALEMLESEVPSLLLLDFHMPELNGAEVLSRLRANPNSAIAQVPVIMLTGDGGEESEVLCLEAGANDFVTKPINLPVLRARIDTQLRLQTLRGQLQQQNNELEAWRENLERDLAAARLTQQSLIPQKPPYLPGWEVAAAYRPVIQVGGDIYGWLRMPDQRTLFWIADATGHGAAAALLTTLAKLLFHHGSVEHSEPARIMEAVNNDFRSIFGARSFMTAMCVALEAASGRASVVGAGHPPLLVTRRGAPAEQVRASAPPLGLLEQSHFEEIAIELQPGDGFFLYTDGLYGSSKREGEGWTPERLQALLASDEPNAQARLNAVLRRAAPESESPLPDDLAAVAVVRTAGEGR